MGRTLLPLLPLLALIALSCGDNAADPADQPPGPETFETFLYGFARAYAVEDSVAYDAYLDSGYTFELLEGEADPDFPEGHWDRAQELAIAGNMFHGRVNEDGKSVRDIDLDLTLIGSAEDRTSYPEKPAGETWYRVTAFVDLLVVANDPDDPSGLLHFIVESNQIFVVRRDPSGSGRYLVYKQIDQQPGAKAESKPGTATGTSWGSVKSYFR
jgi:hypothetical protein